MTRARMELVKFHAGISDEFKGVVIDAVARLPTGVREAFARNGVSIEATRLVVEAVAPDSTIEGEFLSTRMRPDFFVRVARYGLDRELLEALNIRGM